ncbi:hypothetical protein [Peribacillus kribbensis]|nr:hypothetical protein [Peribacillus kribbensis]
MGDLIFRLVMMGVPVVVVVAIAAFWNSRRKKAARLERIEEKLDSLLKK